MASEDVCLVNIAGLSKEDQAQVKKQIDGIIKKAQESADISDLDDAITQALKDYEDFLNAASKIQKRNAYINKRKQQEIVDYVLSNWEDNPAEGLYAHLGGSQIEKTGARNNTGSMIAQFQNRYRNVLRAKLLKHDLFNEFKSGVFDKEIYVAIHAMDSKTEMPKLNQTSIEIAKVVKEIQDLIRHDANKYGGFVRELEGFVISRSHDQYKIKNNMQGWIEWMERNVDWDKSVKGLAPEERRKFLTEQVKEFASGQHIVEPLSPDSSGLKGFSSIAKRMSRSRQFHFKTPELEWEYGQKFGSEGLMNALLSSIEGKGRSIGMMAHLGPNAEMNVTKAVEVMQKKYKESGNINDQAKMSALAKAQAYINDNIMPVLTGRTMIPGNEIAATVESLILSVQRMASLGGSAIASVFGDSAVSAMNVARLEKGFGGFMKGYNEYFSGMFRNLKSDDVQDILADLSVTNDYMWSHLNPRFSDDTAAITKTQRSIRAWENTFFWLSGQNFVDTRARAAAALGLATRIGRRASKSFDELDDGYKRLFDTHNITSSEWDIGRLALTDYNGTKIISIEKINSLDDTIIDRYLASKKLKPSKYQRRNARDEIINKFRTMFQDQQGYHILSADDRLRAAMFGGAKAGTLNSFARKTILQFKQFPLSFIQKALGREIYSASPMSHKVQNIAAIVIATTIGGYVTTNIREMMAGKKPKEFSGRVVAESVLRGGGLGIYGDFLYQLYNDKYGNSIAGTLLGPTVSDAEVFAKSMSGIVQGDPEKFGDNMAKLFSQNIPFSNVFYLKPIVDYAFMNAVKEWISPGSLARAEQRLQEDYGQEYFMLRPQETMLFQ